MKLVVTVGESRADELLSECGVIKTESFSLIDCENAVVILGRNADISRAELRCALGVIADGDEPIDFLPRGTTLVFCGASHKNTVSFTSKRENTITLSLNRSVRCLDGIAEPFEAPVELRAGFSEYDTMSAFAAKILLGTKEFIG